MFKTKRYILSVQEVGSYWRIFMLAMNGRSIMVSGYYNRKHDAVDAAKTIKENLFKALGRYTVRVEVIG